MLRVIFFIATLIIAVSSVYSQKPVSFIYNINRLPYVSPANAHITKAILPQPTTVPYYDYKYFIDDPRSGDSKSQQETRRGNRVKGSYSLIEPDGTRRIVEYTADHQNGFNAVVRREVPATHNFGYY